MAHKDVQRRTWDKAEFEARAREREATERAGRQYKTKEEREKEAAKGALGKSLETGFGSHFSSSDSASHGAGGESVRAKRYEDLQL